VENAAAILTIDLGAIVANWRLLSSRLVPSRCGAVVKAHAHLLALGISHA
jgi:alanine racemase